VKTVKCRLILLEDINVYERTGFYDPSDGIVATRKGFLGRSIDEKFGVDSKHIKRLKTGQALIFIDLKAKTSINPHTRASRDGKMRNYLKYLSEEKFWKGFGKGQLDRQTLIIILFAGVGIAFLIERIFSALGVMIG